MKAVVVDRLMEPEVLSAKDFPEPTPGPREIKIEVRAAGCNWSDILMAAGQYQEQPTLPFVLGREAAGVVAAVGHGVTRFRCGDPVLAMVGHGAFAEYLVVEEDGVRAIPPGMSFEHAAALAVVYPTSHAALIDRAALVRGECLLVHAAAGGVGYAAVQIGHALGARVIATAGGPEKLEIARRAGADVVIDYREESFKDRVLAETAGRGADVIYDSVGGETFDDSLRCIAWKGRLVTVGFAGGQIPQVRVNRILLKNISVVGIHWPAYAEREPGTVDAIFADLFRMYARGEIEPLIHSARPLDQVSAALVALAGRRTVGKLMLIP